MTAVMGFDGFDRGTHFAIHISANLYLLALRLCVTQHILDINLFSLLLIGFVNSGNHVIPKTQ